MKRTYLFFIMFIFFNISTFSFSTETADPKQGEKPVEEKGPKDLKEKIITNSIGMKLCLIEPGEFIMGSVEAEKVPEDILNTGIEIPGKESKKGGGEDDEKPACKVKITEAFYIGMHEVTQAQYEKIMGKNPSAFIGDDLPVEKVSWSDAQEFCKRLSEKEGVTYRLPTEAEWEYACRAGTKTKYYWGDEMDGECVWYMKNSEGKTRNVGTRKPNKWGLYDMSGNVWEWCNDWYTDTYSEKDTINPVGPKEGEYRVVRGGSWHDIPDECRSANRDSLEPERSQIFLGFRVCRNVTKGK